MLSKVLVFFVVGRQLATGSMQNPISPVQIPSLTSCTSTGIVKLSNVSLEDAQLEKTMTVNFAFSISKPLDSHPRAHVTVRNQDGSRIPCLGRVGSCIYRLCGGITGMDKHLGMPWNNKCPVPAISGEESIPVKLGFADSMLIPVAPTTLSVHVEVTDGSSAVGCEEFDVKIEAA